MSYSWVKNCFFITKIKHIYFKCYFIDTFQHKACSVVQARRFAIISADNKDSEEAHKKMESVL